MPRYIEAHISDESLTLMFDVRMRKDTGRGRIVRQSADVDC